MAKRLIHILGKSETLLTYVKDRPGHDRRYALTCDKMERELGWRPSIGLEDGLRETIKWYSENTEWMAGVRGGIIAPTMKSTTPIAILRCTRWRNPARNRLV